MKKSCIRLLAVLVCFGLLAGCSTTLFSPETAIKAPGSNGIYAGVQKALEAAVGQNIILKYPLVGDVNTAFSPRDLDGDGVQEMLAFYQLPSEGAVTRMNLICYQDGEWHSVQDVPPQGSDVANVEFCDLNGDGLEEVCIGWNIFTSRNNQMCIYQLENGLLVQRAAEPYTKHTVCDIDGDGVQEMALATLDAEHHTSTLSFYEIRRDEFTVLGTIELDPTAVGYAKLTAAPISNNNVGVFLDVYKGTDGMITEVVYYRAGKLYNPFAGSKDGANVATLRYSTLLCTDINTDGVLEIPFSELMPGLEVGDTDPTHHIIRWRYYSGAIGDTVDAWWYNQAEGYYLEMDTSWLGEVTVYYDPLEKEYIFYSWNQDVLGDRLFAIKTFTADQWDANANDQYRNLHENTVSVWAVALEPENPLEITYEKLQENFHLILN